MKFKLLLTLLFIVLASARGYAATRTIANGGGNWGDTGTWVEGAVPTSADDVVATATSGNVTINAAAACRSIDLTNYTGTLTHNAFTLSVGDASCGSLTFVAGMTYTPAGDTSAISFVSTTTGNTVTWAGKQPGNVTFNGAGGGWTTPTPWDGRRPRTS